ncbi:MAG: hypothetical protein WBO10_12545 [Pyrinomonadaceae bacterium]
MSKSSSATWFDRPFGDNLLKSLEYLAFKARSHNAIHACESVGRILAEQQKYALYRDIFPKEWCGSKTSLYRAGRYTLYSERVCELFELVSERCFPLLDYWNDDPECEFERFAIMPLNFDLCCEDIEYESMRYSYVAALLFYFRDAEIWDFFFEKYGVSEREFPTINRDPHPQVWKDKQNSKTKPYSQLLRLVDHSTGNPWLDQSHCQYPELFEWNRETIEALASDYRNAENSFKNLENLDEKFDADPRQFLSELICFWNNGCITIA